jgi:hypothetical protein
MDQLKMHLNTQTLVSYANSQSFVDYVNIQLNSYNIQLTPESIMCFFVKYVLSGNYPLEDADIQNLCILTVCFAPRQSYKDDGEISMHGDQTLAYAKLPDCYPFRIAMTSSAFLAHLKEIPNWRNQMQNCCFEFIGEELKNFLKLDMLRVDLLYIFFAFLERVMPEHSMPQEGQFSLSPTTIKLLFSDKFFTYINKKWKALQESHLCYRKPALCMAKLWDDFENTQYQLLF